MSSHYENALQYLTDAARTMEVGARVEKLLVTPQRQLKVEVAFTMDDGSVEVFEGYRVQHNSVRGPFKGGLRYHRDADDDDRRAGAG